MSFSDQEIDSVIDEETRLPSTHRRAYGNERDDVAQDDDGTPVPVPSPETPEDRFN
jgi:hypothetical protein